MQPLSSSNDKNFFGKYQEALRNILDLRALAYFSSTLCCFTLDMKCSSFSLLIKTNKQKTVIKYFEQLTCGSQIIVAEKQYHHDLEIWFLLASPMTDSNESLRKLESKESGFKKSSILDRVKLCKSR